MFPPGSKVPSVVRCNLRYRPKNFRPKQFSAEKISAEKISAENVSAEKFIESIDNDDDDDLRIKIIFFILFLQVPFLRYP